jgi:hypothetical protein
MHGIYLLWWVQERQLSPALVAAVMAIGDLAIMVLEVPTGWLADRCGHRVSLIAGSLAQTAGMLLCWLGEGVPAFVCASVLVGLGDALRSGANEALLYRTCVALDREQDFQRLDARARAAALVALVALVLAGGVIVDRFGYAAGWLAEVSLCAVGLAVACAFAEPPAAASADDHRDPSEQCATPVPVTMAALILPASLLGAAASAALFIAQTATQITPRAATALVAAVTLAEAAGSAVATRAPRAGVRAQTLLAAAGMTLVGVGLARSGLFTGVVIVLSFLMGVAHPLRASALQRLAADDVRARVASVASACDMALSTITLPLAGVWSRRRSRR